MKAVQNMAVANPLPSSTFGVVEYAIQLAEDLKAKLNIVLCYPERGDEQHVVSFEPRLEMQDAFESIKHHLQDHETVSYRLISLDKKPLDGIQETLQTYQPDLIIFNTVNRRHISALVKRYTTPLLLLPPSIQYRTWKKIGLLISDGDQLRRVITYATNLAQLSQAQLIFYVVSNNSDLPVRVGKQFQSLSRLVNYRIHQIDPRMEVAELIKMMKRQSIDLLMITGKSSGLIPCTLPSGGCLKVIQQSQLPVIILKA